MKPLQITFNKPSFTVQEIVVCPCENKRGHVTGYNLVAQGGAPSHQAILGHFGTDVGRDFVGEQVDALKAELNIH